MEDRPRLIEKAFPLKQASLDSVHEKTVRTGHIASLHLWPARRPLAACRAALIATLLPDPGDPKKRQELCEKIGGKVVQVVKKKKLPSGKIEEQVVEETVGGVLHWGRESDPAMDWFREEIKKAYGGRAPKVLDPFAGGGAIPLEAMRLGCEATAIDINPVAWFILKCTLEYPQKLAGQVRPLPKFALESPEFMLQYFKSTGKLTKKQMERNLKAVQMEMFPAPDVDLSWHVRAWGWWVLQQARKELAPFYPTYADYEPSDKKSTVQYEQREPRLVPLNDDGTPHIDALNADFDQDYLNNPRNPRWVGKPTVAYLWARTVKCKNCRATVPLLKTTWLCKVGAKRTLLDLKPDAENRRLLSKVIQDVPVVGGNAAQRREHDKRIDCKTMSRVGAKCPFCRAIMTKVDLQQEGVKGQLGSQIFAVAVDGPKGKEFRLPTDVELGLPETIRGLLDAGRLKIPGGIPTEAITVDAKGSTWCVLYGYDEFGKLFTPRQLCSLGVLTGIVRDLPQEMLSLGYPRDWVEAVHAYLACGVSRFLDFANCGAQWKIDVPTINHSFVRFGLPISWDYVEGNAVGRLAGSFEVCCERICVALDKLLCEFWESPSAHVANLSAKATSERADVAITDPPYYDAISYAAIMDFFYVWLRRVLLGASAEYDKALASLLTPKWDHEKCDGELIDDANRFGGDKKASKEIYEHGMYEAFRAIFNSLVPEGRLVVVFAHKHPDAWEALASALIRAGFVADGSWPIQTEQTSRMRALSSAALSSSVWLVCKKRPETARPGWDNRVLEEMREKISDQLREFWDAGIRGPDFVWAATGPALEAYSKHPVVKKANKPNELMTVSEFLQHVRRMVVDFVVGRVLTHGEGAEAVEGLDDITTYYLLHRNDFGMNEAPSGACIMYAISCGLSDRALADQYDILVSGKKNGGRGDAETWEDEEDGERGADGDAEIEDEEEGEGGGSTVKLVPWGKRTRKSLGYEAPGGKPVPLIDQVHRMMHLWKKGDVIKVDEYLDERGLRNNKLFHQLLQALIELAESGNGERSILESISNHVAGRGVKHDDRTIGTTEVYSE